MHLHSLAANLGQFVPVWLVFQFYFGPAQRTIIECKMEHTPCRRLFSSEER